MAHLLRILTAALELTEPAAFGNGELTGQKVVTFFDYFSGFFHARCVAFVSNKLGAQLRGVLHTRLIPTVAAKFSHQFRGVLPSDFKVVFQ